MVADKKKVLFVSTRFYPDSGGIERSVFNLAKGLSLLGYSVTVLCTGKLDERIQTNGINVIRRKAWLTFSANDINPLLFFDLLAQVRSHDLIITNEPNPFANSLLSIIMLFFKKPLIVYYHSDIVRSGFFSILKKVYESVFQRILFNKAVAILSTTKVYQEISDVLPRYKQKLDVLPNSIDLSAFTRPSQQEIAEFRKRIGVVGKKVILFVGRLIYYKGLDYLLRAYAEVVKRDKSSVLVIVGIGVLETQLKSLAASLGISERVLFVGKVNDSDLKLYYSASDFLVLPSIYKSEAFGIVLLEAMAYGLPVITTTISGTKEVAHGAGTVVQPRDEKALTAAILRLLGDDDLCHDLSIAALNRVRQYDSESVAKSLHEKIKNILGRCLDS